MTTYYLPVVSTGNNWKYQFWRKTCLIHYSHLLVSPFTTGWNIRRGDFDENEKLTIYADSGGYQILTRHEKISALDVLRWQELIADIGFTLDVPPHYFSKDYTREQFLSCMKQSNKNAELMHRFKVNDNMQLWGVIQGKNFDECKAWYEDLIKNHEYDGYCLVLSVHKSMVNLPWIEQLEFAKTLNKRIHFLGSNDRLLILVLSKLSQITGVDYTYDSSTFSVGGRFGRYIHPKTWQYMSFSKDERKRDKIESLPCDCPVCSNRSQRDLIRHTELIDLHNLFVINYFNETVSKLSDEQFFPFLRSFVKNELHMQQIFKLLGFSKEITTRKIILDYKE